MTNEHEILIQELIKLLEGGTAHASFADAIDGLDPHLRGVKLDKIPYSIWQLVEHIRIAQWDMLEFSRHANHQSPKWPEGYWPKESAPKDEHTWERSLEQIENDRNAFIKLLQSEQLYDRIPHGNGQSILREALQIADHNSYHIAEIVIIRRLLGSWAS